MEENWEKYFPTNSQKDKIKYTKLRDTVERKITERGKIYGKILRRSVKKTVKYILNFLKSVVREKKRKEILNES